MSKLNIYELKLNEELQTGHLYVLRVPGGWIYYDFEGAMCFVPYDNEFQGSIKKPVDHDSQRV